METKETTALVTFSEADVSIILKDVDTSGMTKEDKQQVAMILYQDMEQSIGGFLPRPQSLKINKDTQQFYDSLGNYYDEAVGVLLHKMMTRGFWGVKKSKIPVCSSLDCITGKVSLEETLFDYAKNIFFDLRDFEFEEVLAMKPEDANKILTCYCKGCPMNEWGTAQGDEGDSKKGKACKEMRRLYLLRKDAIIPAKIVLPPTSINAWDDYLSERVNQRISDLSAMVNLRLAPKKDGSYTWSVVVPKLGPRQKPAEIVKAAQTRQRFVSTWNKEEVTSEDYETDSTSFEEGDIPID